jgi:D-alanyl-D-alanine carboxypeptidase/D-alanyl-D-alanine-endopeptidase (penicillin-binding protein 4)
LALLALVVVGAVVAGELQLGWGRAWLDETLDPPDPLTAPAEVEPPPGLELPELVAPAPVAQAAAEPAVAPRAVRRALAADLEDPDLGAHVVVAVAGVDAGPVVTTVDGRRGDLVTPASTTKLLTTTAALEALGPDHVFTTRTVLSGSRKQRRVTIVGGGDPYLASKPADPDAEVYPARADVVTLARLTARELRRQGVRTVEVGFDDSLFTGPVASPDWEPGYLPDDVVSPITALWVDGGRPESGFGRVDDPSGYAARVFADALRRQRIKIRGELANEPAPPDALDLAEVSGSPLDQVVEHVLEVSDNEAAEVLAHQVGLAVVGEGSFAGGRRGVADTLGGLGVDLSGDEVYDGSGLSRKSRVRIDTLVDVLQVAAAPERPELRPVVTGLPVAGFTGSLALRFDATNAAAGAGLVRAKTGTLSGVHGLAGIVTDATGEPLVVVAVADGVPRENDLANLEARLAVDRLVAALTTCSCTR